MANTPCARLTKPIRPIVTDRPTEITYRIMRVSEAVEGDADRNRNEIAHCVVVRSSDTRPMRARRPRVRHPDKGDGFLFLFPSATIGRGAEEAQRECAQAFRREGPLKQARASRAMVPRRDPPLRSKATTPCSSASSSFPTSAPRRKRRRLFPRSPNRRGGRSARLHAHPHRRALFPALRRLQPQPDRVSRRRGAAHEDGAAGHRRRAAGVQQSAQARRRDRHARRDLAAAGSMSVSRARSCRTSSAASASRPTRSLARFREGMEQVDLLLDAGERHPSRASFHRSRT